MRNQFPECPNRSCQCDITASNELRDLPKYLHEANAFKAIDGEVIRNGCEYCVRETVESVAKKWLAEGAFEDVSRLLAEYVGLPAAA